MKKCVKWKGSDHRKVSFECSVGKNCRNSFYCGMILYFFVFSSLINLSSCLPPVIKIGAIFVEDQKDSAAELAFKYAVYRLNKERSILPNTTLMYDIQYVPKEDTFHTSKTACKQISNGVQAVFGPSDPLLGAHIQSICDALEIPHLESRLDTEIHVKGSQEFTVNLHPSQELLNSAYKDLMTYLNWTKVAIVYEENGAETVNSKGLIRLQDLVRTPTKNTEVYIRQATPSTYRHVMDELKQREMFNIIIDTKPETIQLLFRAILQLQMNDYRYHYFFTSLDVETFDLEDFKYNSVNITAFRLVDSENIRSRLLLRDMERFQPIGHSILNKTNVIKTAPALMFDSVMSLAHGLAALDRGATLRIANVSCEDEKPWSDGTSLFNYVNTVEFQGLTGPVRFQDGRRANFKLDLLKLRRDELLKVGEWKQQSGLNITAPKYFFEGGSPNITLIVMTNEKADLAVGSMTINYARENVIDFTKPFMNLGISILFKVPGKIPPQLFSFMNPLAIEIWMSILVAYTLVSLTLWLIARFSPFEWVDVHPCLSNSNQNGRTPSSCKHQTPVVMKQNDFTMGNAFWFTVGSLMQQGSDLNPQAASTRIVGGIWWFFTLIIISSYTANLAAFLTVERMITPIESAEDLADQSEIAYGTLGGGSTMTFFRDSKIETYQKMWRFMESKQPSVFVSAYDEGINRVLEGNYAFLMESTTLDYVVQRNCNLTQIGGLLDSKGYGIATQKGSPWRDKISLAILELQENGIIQMLYSKWWRGTGDICNRDEKKKESKANALGIENIGGVFVVLLCGLALAIVVAILEFCWNSKKNAQMDRQSLCSEMAEELRFALRCQGSRQRPALRRPCSRCAQQATGPAYISSNVRSSESISHRENGMLPMLERRKSGVQSFEIET
ncbi:glutamate receptor ionotropic, kainate 2-like isoform X13 [Artemia franciscana]|uniref:glutamate receptor ionotropic, kainate 2-like isoform X13 n=1 Tax=Artemia franciscana TaxID=6661 RepID=UPI0032DB4399